MQDTNVPDANAVHVHVGRQPKVATTALQLM